MKAGIDSRRVDPARATTAQPTGTTQADISHETPLTRSAAYQAARELLRKADGLMADASADYEDEMARAIKVARNVMASPESMLEQDGDYGDILDEIYDAESVIKAVEAFHADNGKGLMLREALRLIDQATTIVDRGAVMDASPRKPAPAAAAQPESPTSFELNNYDHISRILNQLQGLVFVGYGEASHGLRSASDEVQDGYWWAVADKIDECVHYFHKLSAGGAA